MTRILVAEDSPTQSLALCRLLESAGYEVAAAANGREALDLIGVETPDLVLTDVAMPEMDGHELCEAIKGSPDTAGIPVVMITVMREPADIVRGLLSGADNFLPKPYDADDLLERVHRIFEHRDPRSGGDTDAGVTINVEGRSVTLNADKQQIVELLLAIADELGQANADLHRKEKDLKSTLQQLRVAKEEAESANQAKSEFLSRMSHELRTPLNSVMGFGQLLQMEDLAPAQKDDVDLIIAAGHHLLELINDVLDISRIETGRMTLSAEPLEVRLVVREAVDMVSSLAQARSIDLAVCNGVGGFVMADRHRLKQVLINLLSNAIKYNHDGGTVVVEIATRDDHVLIAVADSGPGIDPALMDRLFTPFDRLGAEMGQVEGTGLGLPLARGLVEAMGGVLEAASVPGEGSTFTVELRAGSSEQPGEATEARAEEHAEAPARAAGTVLYVEDNLPNVELVKRVFARRPEIELLVATQGSDGLELARRRRPDLILLDVHLTDMRGDEVLRHLREDTLTESIPVVMVSADATAATVSHFESMGVAGYLTKPLDLRRFMEVVDGLLAGGPPDT